MPGKFGREEERDAGDYDRYSLGLQNVNNTCQIVHLFLHLRMNVAKRVTEASGFVLLLVLIRT